MAVNLIPTETNVFRIVLAIIQLIQGRSDAVLEVTLTPNAAITVVTAVNCGANSEVFLSPRTANAAAAISTTFISSVNRGSFTITHANNAQVDRRYGIVGLG